MTKLHDARTGETTELRNPQRSVVIERKNVVIEVSLDRSEVDDVLVMHIDTPDILENAEGPVMRIYLNDEPIHENPPLSSREPERTCLRCGTVYPAVGPLVRAFDGELHEHCPECGPDGRWGDAHTV